MNRSLGLTAIIASTFLLGACGGGGDSAAPVVSYAVNGTVAYGHPVQGQSVQVTDSAGNVCATATTAVDGSYSMITTACAPGAAAFSVHAYTTPTGAPLMAVAMPAQDSAVINGVVNVTPLTTLVAYSAAGFVSSSTIPKDSAAVLALLPKVTAAQYQQAKVSVLVSPLLQVLQANYGVTTTGFDPMTAPFAADGTGVDGFFDAYPLTATSAAVQLTAPSAAGPLVQVTLPSTTSSNSTVTSTSSYSIGGTVSGLSSGSLVLQLNGGSPLTVPASGAFSFTSQVSSGYAVTVSAQPVGQTCTVGNGSGTGLTANISNVSVVCSTDTYTISGNVTGLLSSTSLVLQNNGADPTTVSTNGVNAFTFAMPVAFNGSYAITVATQPAGETCTVSNASGSGVTADVASVAVNCSANTYTVAGSVSGLASGAQVTLDNNGADPAVVTADGSFAFSLPVAYNGSYVVTVGTQPMGQTCTVSNASGSGMTVNVANVAVVCSTNTYTVAGSVTGLGSGVQLTLTDNGADPLTVTADGDFTFEVPVVFNGSYAIAVGTQPVGQTCTVSNATGAGVTANVSNPRVTCSVKSYTVSGNVAGLTSGVQVTLRNNGADSTTVPGSSNGAFTFAVPVAYSGSYAVTVGTQPVGKTCTASNGSGSTVTANITNVSVIGSTNTYTISGTVSGLASSTQVTLNNNSADPLTVTTNGSFSFATPVVFGGSYAVTVGTQPVGKTCSVTQGSGSGVAGNVSNVTVNCVTPPSFVYVPDYSYSRVLGYRIDPDSNSMQTIPGSPFASGTNDRWIATSPSGNFAYALNQSANSVTAYQVNRTTGALTTVPGGAVATGSTPISMTVNPAGTFTYSADANSGSISGFSIDPSTGALTPIPGSPFAAGTNPTHVVFTPSGAFAYVTNQNGASISAYAVNAQTGVLTEIPGSPFATDGAPLAETVNPAGTRLYVANNSANATVFSIDQITGALTPIAGSPFAAAGNPYGFVSVAINPAGTFAYMGTGNPGQLLSFGIDSVTGAMTFIPANSYGNVGSNYMTFNSTGTLGYIANAWYVQFSVVRVDPTTGALTDLPGSPYYAGARPFNLGVVAP